MSEESGIRGLGGLLAMSEPQGKPATHLQPRPREPTRLMKTFFSLFS